MKNVGYGISGPRLAHNMYVTTGECMRISANGKDAVRRRNAGLLRPLTNDNEWEVGGQGWIRTSVRKTGQIYSLSGYRSQ